MKSVEALRKWADGLSGIWLDPNDHSIIVTTCDDTPPSMDCVSLREHVNGILDEIEREVADMRDFCERLDDAATKREDVTLWGVDYTPLPVDADGVPIHVGDVLDGYGKTIEVVEIRHGRSGWVLISRDGNAYADCAAFSHHHAPTVEDVLREFYTLAVRGKAANANDVDNAVLAEYAARLRLAGDE